MTEPKMIEFTITRNPRTSFYDIHIAGCAHTRLKKPWDHAVSVNGTDVDAVIEDWETGNEGCFTHVAPCVAKAGLARQSPESKARQAQRKAGYF